MKNQDKIAHFFVSGWVYLMLIHFSGSIPFSFLTTFLIGVTKEWYDDRYRQGADMHDIMANILGILISGLLYEIK